MEEVIWGELSLEWGNPRAPTPPALYETLYDCGVIIKIIADFMSETHSLL